MKSFLKIVALVVIALICVKLLPLTFALGCALALAVLGLVGLGVSAVAAFSLAVLVLAAVLAPIWIPLLLLVGLIALVRRCFRGKSGAAV